MWDTVNAVIFSCGLAQFFASLIPTDFSRLSRDPAQSGFPLRYLLTGGHPLLLPLFFCLIFGAIYMKLLPALVVSYAVKAGGIGGIIFSVLALLTFVSQWYRRSKPEKQGAGVGGQGSENKAEG